MIGHNLHAVSPDDALDVAALRHLVLETRLSSRHATITVTAFDLLSSAVDGINDEASWRRYCPMTNPPRVDLRATVVSRRSRRLSAPAVGDGRTRLVTRVHVLYDWSRPAYSIFGLLLMEFGDFPMMLRMLPGIKKRVESARPAK